MQYTTQAEHEMSRMKGPMAVFGAAVLMLLLAACGNGTEPTSLSDVAPTQAPPTVGGTTPTDTTPTESVPPTTPIVSDDGPTNDLASLLDNLSAAGVAVDTVDTISQPFFAPRGQRISVDGHGVQAFEFASAEEADAAAATVSADGNSVGTSMVGWLGSPHFYKTGKVIVIYIGGTSEILSVLEAEMGPEFAGSNTGLGR